MTNNGVKIVLPLARWVRVWLVTLVLGAPLALASSVEQLDFDGMADLAELVFEGEVVGSEANWNATGSRIYTTIKWRVDEVIKGNYQNSTLQLRFAGGRVGDAAMVVEGLIYPVSGESGIYFVETLQRQLVNPLLGWSQGHFLIDQSRGADNATIMLADKRPLMNITKPVSARPGQLLSDGKARGLVTGSKTQSGISKTEFKRLIQQTMQASSQVD